MIERESLHQKIIDELKLIYQKLKLIEAPDVDLVETLYLKRAKLINILKKSNFRSSTEEEKALFKNLIILDSEMIKKLSLEKSSTLQEIKSHNLAKKTHQAYLSYGGKNGKG